MSQPPAKSSARQPFEQGAMAEAVLRHVNEGTGVAWQLGSRFANGALQGAWRIHDRSTVAVLKLHDGRSTVAPSRTNSFVEQAPCNPDGPAIVDYVRAAGYPTPAWLASGTTEVGVAWSVQEFVDGEPLRELDRVSAEIFIDLARLQRTLRLPTSTSWNQYICGHVFDAHPSHQRVMGAGEHGHRLLAAALALAAPHESVMLVDNEMVHSDLNVSNVLTRHGRLVAVIDVDGAGRGCAAYDVLSPAANGVWWNSDPEAINKLVNYALDNYGPAPAAIAAACLAIETTDWYVTSSPDVDRPVARLLNWIGDLNQRLQ